MEQHLSIRNALFLSAVGVGIAAFIAAGALMFVRLQGRVEDLESDNAALNRSLDRMQAAIGSAGARGEQGARGPMGPPGPQGEKGATGPAGKAAIEGDYVRRATGSGYSSSLDLNALKSCLDDLDRALDSITITGGQITDGRISGNRISGLELSGLRINVNSVSCYGVVDR